MRQVNRPASSQLDGWGVREWLRYPDQRYSAAMDRHCDLSNLAAANPDDLL